MSVYLWISRPLTMEVLRVYLDNETDIRVPQGAEGVQP